METTVFLNSPDKIVPNVSKKNKQTKKLDTIHNIAVIKKFKPFHLNYEKN